MVAWVTTINALQILKFPGICGRAFCEEYVYIFEVAVFAAAAAAAAEFCVTGICKLLPASLLKSCGFYVNV